MASSFTSTFAGGRGAAAELASRAAGIGAAEATVVGAALSAGLVLECAPSQPSPQAVTKTGAIRQKDRSFRTFRAARSMAEYAYHALCKKGDAPMIDREQLDRSVPERP